MSKPENSIAPPRMIRPPAEAVYAEELAALAANDNNARPPGWKLSPRAVRKFIVGADAPLTHTWQGSKKKTVVAQKFYGDDALLRESGVSVECPPDVLELLVTTFNDLGHGRTEEGTVVERPSTIMSTAEAVAVSHSAALDAAYFGNGRLESGHVTRQLLGMVLKDNPDDLKKLKHYFEVVVKARGKGSKTWQQFCEAKKWLRG